MRSYTQEAGKRSGTGRSLVSLALTFAMTSQPGWPGSQRCWRPRHEASVAKAQAEAGGRGVVGGHAAGCRLPR